MDTAEMVEVKNFETPQKTREMISDELRRDLEDWMTTDWDLTTRPLVNLTRAANEFEARVLVSGIAPKDIEVMVAPEALLIKGEAHVGSGQKKLLTWVQFPRLVNPDKVHADIHDDGMLCVAVEIAEDSAQTFAPKAA